MKNMKIFLTILAVVLVLGMAVVGCDNGDGDKSSSSFELKDVPAFSQTGAYKDFNTPIVMSDVEEVYNTYIDDLEEQLNSLVEGLSEGLHVTVVRTTNRASRAVQQDRVKGDLKKYLQENQIPIPDGVIISGNVDASYKYDDEVIFPVELNGSASLEVTLTEAFDLGDDEFGVVGKIKGSVNVNNVKMTDEEHLTGSAGFTYYCAFNFAFIDEQGTKKYAKFITDISAPSINLASQTGKVTATLSIYGAGTTPLKSDTFTITLTQKK